MKTLHSPCLSRSCCPRASAGPTAVISRCLMLALPLACVLPALAASLDLSPTLLHPQDGPALVPALQIESAGSKTITVGTNTRIADYGYRFQSTLATEPRRNTEPTKLDLRGSLKWSLARSGVGASDPGKSGTVGGDLGGDIGGDLGPPPEVVRPVMPGFVFARLSAAYETDQILDNQQLAAGVVLNYERDPTTAHRWLFPSLWVDYRRVHELGSKVSERLGVDEQRYWRLGASIKWDIALADLGLNGPVTGKLRLVPAFEYYKSTDLALVLRQADLDESRNTSLKLICQLPEKSGLGKYLHDIRFSIAHGRVPPATKNQTTLSFAIRVRWDKLIR